MAFDPWAAYNRSYERMTESQRDLNRRQRQAPLDELILAQGEQGLRKGELGIKGTELGFSNLEERRALEKQIAAEGLSPLEATEKRRGLVMGQGDYGEAQRIQVSDQGQQVLNEALKRASLFGNQAGAQYGAQMGLDPSLQTALANMKQLPNGSFIAGDTERGGLMAVQMPDGSYELRNISPQSAGGRGGGPGSYPNVAELRAKGWAPSSRMTEAEMRSLEDTINYAKENNIPFGPEEAYAFEKRAQTNRATGRTGGSRLVLQRKQNIEAATGLLDDLEKTNKQLDFNDVQFAGIVDKWASGQLNDPILTEYMAQRADALFVLGNALKQNGLTDKSIEVEEEAFRPTLAPKAFSAWINTQRRALNRASREMERDYGYQMEQTEVTPAGVGGAGPKGPQEDIKEAPTRIVRTDADYEKLKSGDRFQAPDGTIRIKP